ncbi:DUF6545 domain-containing protein [Kutzneria kofuensis]|uniref:DUF6545 domain-containing protein n=1 Tax=Kutzneria kofuensis TaxID=103725 RepID=A0A7W9NEF8_9PSEU|nr:DUF6545 domain-containing protein [Kutzneria kofuensis]MBB5890272.1 hypothetical protein [Kutzneria kofuensis]
MTAPLSDSQIRRPGTRARYARRLIPLWQRLTDEFPHIALPHTGNDFERITVEITENLAELARYGRLGPGGWSRSATG